MATASERITVLVTPAEKKRIAKLAKEAGVSRGEFLRRRISESLKWSGGSHYDQASSCR